MKLQDAYVGESNQIGSWTLIGYTGPGTAVSGQTDSTTTTNFNYGGCEYKGADGKATIGDAAVEAKIGWVATSKAALNDVGIGAQWTLSVAAEASKSVVSYTAGVPEGAESLTPNFSALSH